MSNATSSSEIELKVEAFFDPSSNTISYVVQDPDSQSCAVIDSVMDFQLASGRVSFESADKIIQHIQSNQLELEWIIETHVHADHLSAAPYIQERLGGKTAVSAHILTIQETFGKFFNEGTEFQRDGSQFDFLFADGDDYKIGNLEARALLTPGHTPACMTHVIGKAAFVGDTLFMPDGGSARADFPGGDAAELYESIMRVLALPEDTILYICHDYGPNGRDIEWKTTVADQRAFNIHVGGGKTKEEFVTMRTTRDAQLSLPALIIPSIQVNMRAGHLPTDTDGNPNLTIPINKF